MIGKKKCCCDPEPDCAWFCGPKGRISCTGGPVGGNPINVITQGGVVTDLTGVGITGCTANPTIVIDAPISGGTTATATAKAGGVTGLMVSTKVASITIAGGVLSIAVTLGGTLYSSPPVITIAPPGGAGVTATATATINLGGSGYTTAPLVTIGAPSLPGGTTATATATLTAGVVTSVAVTSPGSGYTTAPVVTIDPPGAGVQAEAFSLINPLGGTLYGSPPTVTIAAPGGSGTTATATAILTGGTVTGFTITSKGSLYTTAHPVVTIAGPGGSGVTAEAIATASVGVVTEFTITNPGSGYVDSKPVPKSWSCTITAGSITIGPITLINNGGGSRCLPVGVGCGCIWGVDTSFTAIPTCGPFTMNITICLACDSSFSGWHFRINPHNGGCITLVLGQSPVILPRTFSTTCTARPKTITTTSNVIEPFWFQAFFGGAAPPQTITFTATEL